MDQAVVLARGLGTRMRRQEPAAELNDNQAAAAETGIKGLIPVGRPFLDYVIGTLVEAGYRRVCLVIGPEHEAIRAHYRQLVRTSTIAIEFAVQQEARGTADAVAAAEDFAAGNPFLMINSDTLYPAAALAALRGIKGSGVAVFERRALVEGNNIPPDRIRHFSVALLGMRGELLRILEKPDEAFLHQLPEPHWIGMNCWRFEESIFEACRNIGPSIRGELEITEAVRYAIEVLKVPFATAPVRAAVLDLSYRSDIRGVAEKLAGKEVTL